MGIASSTAQGGAEDAAAAWPRRAFVWGAWSVVLAPLGIVLHELGHLLTARESGFPNATLHFSGVDPNASVALTGAAAGLVALAGPGVSAALALAGCGWFRWRAPVPWAGALAVAAASRFAVGVPYTVVNAAVRLVGGRLKPPAFDEYRAATALGWSGDLLLAVTSLLLALVLWWIGRRIPRRERLSAWLGLIVGTALGWVAWMQVLGPRLLP